MTSAAPTDNPSNLGAGELPAQVPCLNSDTPANVYVENDRVGLQQRGRNTMEFDPDDAEFLAAAMARAAGQARAAQQDAAVLSFARGRR